MATASTKRRPKKGQATDAKKGLNSAGVPRTVQSVPVDELAISASTWTWASLAVMLVATFLRLYALELKPMHHDEGVNGFFLTNLLRTSKYSYDPSNYHGPTLYYLSLPVVGPFGLSTFGVRFVTAAFGVATVWLVLRLRRYVGAVSALAGAALLAVSPGAVYYSRYFIHESLFVFFTLGIVVAALRFYETGRAAYLLLASVSAGMLFATKETAFISAGVLLLALAFARGYARLTRGRPDDEGTTGESRVYEVFSDPAKVALWAAGPLAVFVFVNVLFYSSFFTNAKGVEGAIETFKIWSRTAKADHTKPFLTYVWWLLQQEAPTFLLAAAGSCIALLRPLAGRRVNRFAIFAGAWAFGLLLAYSLIGYKTPWLVLSFIAPMAIVAGYAVGAVHNLSGGVRGGRVAALALAGLALAASTYQSVVLNFREYDNDRYPYVYAHTRRETLELVRQVNELARRAGTRDKTNLTIVSPDYWPLPWYFRDYSNVGYGAQVLPSYNAARTPIVIGKDTQLAQLRSALGPGYRQVGDLYVLRPGVNLVLFSRADLHVR